LYGQMRKWLLIAFGIILLSNSANAVEKRGIGILPFDNLKNDREYDWISFGFQYLLSNKLAHLSAYYVPDHNVIKKALVEAGWGQQKINGEMVYHIGKSTGINVGITGNFSTNGNTITVNIDFINSFNGASIFSKQYNKNNSELFSIADDIAKNLLQVTAVNLTGNEKAIMNRKITSSVQAYEQFCLGYIENEKSNKNYEVTIGLFKKAIIADPKFWEAYYNLGIIYFNNRDYDNAIRQFDVIISSLPNFEKPYFGRGLIYLRKEQYEKAMADFTKVTKFNPNDYKPYYYLGVANIQRKKFSEAKKNLDKSIELNPDYANSYYQLGNLHFLANNYRPAIPQYKKALEIDPENYEAHQRLGESYYRVNTYYSAYSEFKKILAAYPNDPEANFMLGITAYKQAVLGELIEAFLEMFDPSVAAEQRERNKMSGSTRERREVYKEMAASFRRAQNSRQGFLEATFNLALTYDEMEKLDSALAYYSKALQIQPDLIRAHIKKAKVLERMGQKDAALAIYKQVVYIEPGYFVAHPTLGPIHHYINILDVVLDEINTNLKSNPDDTKANLTLAKIYQAQGFNDKAANIYRKILSINPNDREAKKNLAQLEKR
jgi:tetratricopeptide (TPR) repeat protein